MVGMNDIMKTMKEMQSKMESAQDDIKSIEVKGSAGAGMVEVVMNGSYQVKSIQMSDELLNESKHIMQDIVVAAVNDAVRHIEQTRNDKMANFKDVMPFAGDLFK